MKFEDYKKEFNQNFSKINPHDFVKEMKSLGYKFETITTHKPQHPEIDIIAGQNVSGLEPLYKKYRRMMKTYTFEKNELGKWFVVLPEFLEKYPGHEGELQMVFGADTMLDIIGQGENIVHLKLSLMSFENADVLEKLHNTPDVGGAMYVLKTYKGFEYNLEMWLCGVTEFVFGHMPEKIYLS